MVRKVLFDRSIDRLMAFLCYCVCVCVLCVNVLIGCPLLYLCMIRHNIGKRRHWAGLTRNQAVVPVFFFFSCLWCAKDCWSIDTLLFLDQSIDTWFTSLSACLWCTRDRLIAGLDQSIDPWLRSLRLSMVRKGSIDRSAYLCCARDLSIDRLIDR